MKSDDERAETLSETDVRVLYVYVCLPARELSQGPHHVFMFFHPFAVETSTKQQQAAGA